MVAIKREFFLLRNGNDSKRRRWFLSKVVRASSVKFAVVIDFVARPSRCCCLRVKCRETSFTGDDSGCCHTHTPANHY